MTSDRALLELLRALRQRDYQFTTVTPATHARVAAREPRRPPDLRDIFGWNRPFCREDLEAKIYELMAEAALVETLANGALKSRVRVAKLDGDLFLHSAFPIDEADAVFFGPDTYRFVRFIDRHLATSEHVGRVVDMGAGAGAGGIAVARRQPEAKIALVDINARAIEFARVNAEAAGAGFEFIQSSQVPEDADLLIANPPYMMDAAGRAYRDGGGVRGGAVALDWVRQALAAFRPGGRILLYTGAAYVSGGCPLLEAIADQTKAAAWQMAVEEIDPDVFGEELETPAYAEVERIAAVGIVLTAPGP